MEYAPSAPLARGVAGLRSALVEAERIARYSFAAQLAEGKRVLEVGCGVGDGSVILAEAGAAEVIGVDDRAALVEAAQGIEHSNLRFEQRTLDRLEFPNNSFGLVVCLDVIDRIEGAETTLSELARLLADDGVLAVSWPSDFSLDAALDQCWRYVRVLGQESWVGSAVLDGSEPVVARSKRLDGIEVRGWGAGRPQAPPHTLALASTTELPPTTPVAALTGAVDPEAWLRGWDERLRDLDEQRERIAELATVKREREELRMRLIDAEASAERVLQLEADLEQAEWQHGELRREVDALSQILMDVMGSLSWRLTEPLRVLKRWRGRSR
jgi:SAM-dependent methyltransferase